MSAFISWYLLFVILGWLTFPLTFYLFPNFADRGYSLARVVGLLIWGYLFWLLASLGISQNDTSGILLALALLVGLSLWAGVNHQASIVNFFKSNLRLIIIVEILFLSTFALLAFVRSANPEILGTEKPMELAFINAILRSPTFPPRDPWLSGYAISYYYFGYLLTAMLAKVTLVPGTLAFNLMLALVFALGALGAYGILYNLLALTVRHGPQTMDNPIVRSIPFGNFPQRHSWWLRMAPLLAPLFLLLVSNLEGFFHLMYTCGYIRSAAFWKWLDIKDLTGTPLPPYEIPNNFWWWWRASRVVQDYDLLGNAQEIIDEFPFFSFLLGDLHPHVLAIPFGLLVIAVAFNIYLGASRGDLNLFGAKLHLSPLDLFFTGLILGGIAFINTWDTLFAAALIIFSYVLFRARSEGWHWERIEDLVLFAFPLAVLAILLYLPFYLGFSSQASGPLPDLINPTRGAHLWVMFAPLFLPVIAYLYWFKDKPRAAWWRSAAILIGLLLLLWGGSWLLAFAVQFKEPALAAQYLASQRVQNLGELFKAAYPRRFEYIGGLITLFVILIPALGYLLSLGQRPQTIDDDESSIPNGPSSTASPLGMVHSVPFGDGPLPNTFIFFLICIASLLILGPDFIYLRDQFGWRINTIFKFYYQAWILLSLAASFATAMLLKNLHDIGDVLSCLCKKLRGLVEAFIHFIKSLHGIRDALSRLLENLCTFFRGIKSLRDIKDVLFSLLNNLRIPAEAFTRIVIGLTILASLIYPAFSLPGKTNDFKPSTGLTLDDFDRVMRENPDEASAILFLGSVPDGVIVEAVGGSYSGYARVSTYTGLQTVLGWPGHESQWRGGSTEQGTRQDDIRLLYSTANWDTARDVLNKYNIRYVYIGSLERTTYVVQEEKFRAHSKMVFQQGIVAIYEVP